MKLKTETVITPIGIITISHGRDEIFRLWCASIRRLRSEVGWFPVVVAGDEQHKPICDEYDIYHWTRPNEPASRKWDDAMEVMMLDERKVKYVMISGSDDIISTALLKNILSLSAQDYDLIGIKKIYFYCAEGLYKGRVRGIESKQFLGVCKTLHRRVIEKMGTLWTLDRSWGMDADCTRNTSPHIRTQALAEGVVFDIKTNENLNRYTMVQNKETNEKNWPFEVEDTLLWTIIGDEEKQILKNYEKIGNYKRS